MKAAIEKHPFLSFVLIAFGWTWPLAALIKQSMLFPLLALFGPCVAAIVVIYARHGRRGLAELGRKFRLKRAHLPWCILAALLPVVLLVPVWLLHAWWWGFIGFKVSSLSLLSFVLAVLILGEEVGWRGFLLPHLLERYSPLSGSLILGLVWASWHLPNFLMKDYPHYGLSYSAFVIMTLAFSVIFTWLYLNTAGSLLVAVIFHAALNLFSLDGVEASRQYWLKAIIYTLAALALGGVMFKYHRRRVVTGETVRAT
jgi:membrane protease YdiL (CAAX protease family)